MFVLDILQNSCCTDFFLPHNLHSAFHQYTKSQKKVTANDGRAAMFFYKGFLDKVKFTIVAK